MLSRTKSVKHCAFSKTMDLLLALLFRHFRPSATDWYQFILPVHQSANPVSAWCGLVYPSIFLPIQTGKIIINLIPHWYRILLWVMLFERQWFTVLWSLERFSSLSVCRIKMLAWVNETKVNKTKANNAVCKTVVVNTRTTVGQQSILYYPTIRTVRDIHEWLLYRH